jgi:hypothetical protein
MSKRVKVALALAVAVAAGGALVMPACESVPLTAAPGTEMTLIANPTFVIANGGVSVVTAILVEPAGTFVPDGTEVFFFTNLGRVDASGKSHDGVVRVNFVSDARSGTATVTAVSGGPAPASTGTPSPSPTPAAGGDLHASAGSGVAALGVSAAAGQNSATVDISIGSALPARVQVTANPPVLATARSATIVANVFDANGNPVQNVPVIFTAAPGTSTGTTAPPFTEVLDSGGAPRFTDANGQAFDTLTTKSPTGTLQKTVVVTATTANNQTNDVTVTINYGVAPRG